MTYDSSDGIETIPNITKSLLQNVSGEANLTTEGYARITVPNGIVEFESEQTFTCEISPFRNSAKWFLVIGSTETVITGGTEVIVYPDNNTLALQNASDVFRGLYTCQFKDPPMIHQAKAFLDVALLPEINIHSNPQFPDCRNSPNNKITVTVTCSIKNSSEPYNVTWENRDFTNSKKENKNDQILHTIDRTIDCPKNQKEDKVSCTFVNRKYQTKTKNLTIYAIYADSEACKTEGDWPAARRDKEARLDCQDNKRGQRTRKCAGNGKWEPEISYCVNDDIDDITQKAKNLQRGLGNFTTETVKLFQDLKKSTQKDINSSANIEASVSIFATIRDTSSDKKETLASDVLPDFLTSANNLIDERLNGSWTSKLAAAYLLQVNGLLDESNVTENFTKTNLELRTCAEEKCMNQKVFDVKVEFESDSDNSSIVATGYRTLMEHLPLKTDQVSRGIVLQVTAKDAKTVKLTFETVNRFKNHKMHCVVWDPNVNAWSSDGCRWGGADAQGECECDLSSTDSKQRSSGKTYKGASFTVLMSKYPVVIPYMNDLTTAGLIVSIASLVICILIEIIVWNSVVKSDIAHFRHTAVINISLSLLLADTSFLATAFNSAPSNWCWWLVIVKHYCFLAMFFWMLCFSLVLLHSLIFVFQHLSKKVFLGTSFTVGYICPLIIVVLTYIAYENGKPNSYYLPETCWLKYDGTFKGSFFAFVIPVGIIVCINILSMMVVIVRLLKPSVSEGRSQDDKDVIRSILKAVILLTPIFGVTWIFGFFILMVDYTQQPMAEIVNYFFIACNAFQGFFILVTACLSEKKVYLS
ncbi:hypothetical protein ACEWY4_005341 [Coilia grayii]|uniref:Uncharacterized protein n=1 Tax=Coilia grayii TaxID=363190 RepID=A0ABD1KI12_9TELE